MIAIALHAQTADKPVRAVTDPGIITTRQAITPAGVPMVFEGRVYGVAFGKTSADLWVLSASRLYRLDWLHWSWQRLIHWLGHGIGGFHGALQWLGGAAVARSASSLRSTAAQCRSGTATPPHAAHAERAEMAGCQFPMQDPCQPGWRFRA